MFRRTFLVSISALLILCVNISVFSQTAAKAEDADEAKFAAQARKLDPSTPKKDRLAALEWLTSLYMRPEAGKVMPDVERCLKKDADAEVRAKAATALGLIAYKRKPPVCPLAVVEALRDSDKEVRARALDVAGLFREFAPGAVDILLRCAKEGDRDFRASVITLLPDAGRREEKVLQFLRDATTDKDFLIRNNAHAALFNATGKLEDIVPHCLRVQLEFTNMPSLPAFVSEETKRDYCMKQLVQWGALAKLHEFEEKHGEELAKMVLTQLKQPSAQERRAAAFLIGEYSALLEKLKRDDPRLLVVLADKNQKKDASPPLRLLDRLRAMKVEDQLRKLAEDDPDKQVRAAAKEALKKLAGRKENRP